MGTDSAPSTDQVTVADRPASIGISRTLFAGLMTSVVVMILGLLLVAAHGTSTAIHVVPLDRIVPELMKGSRPALLDSGILLLFATPLLGVVVAFVQFVRQRDAVFALIAGLLLAVLSAGFLVALR